VEVVADFALIDGMFAFEPALAAESRLAEEVGTDQAAGGKMSVWASESLWGGQVVRKSQRCNRRDR
jgi:hypothetical protein